MIKKFEIPRTEGVVRGEKKCGPESGTFPKCDRKRSR